MARTTYLIANWKMNPVSLAEAKKIVEGIKKPAAQAKSVTTIVCPPFVFLPELMRAQRGNAVAFGAQNAFYEKKGSYTGEVSPAMLKGLGVTHVILGHSERRALGEENDLVRKKVHAALAEGLAVILCVGERARDAHGEYLSFLQEQLHSALAGLERRHLRRLSIAYEPVWAIGKSADDAMRPQDVHEMTLMIRKVLIQRFDKKAALALPILYGGSVEPANCEELLREGHVDGFLVGHASRVPKDFAEMLRLANAAS